MNPQGRFKFTLVRIERIAADCYEFVLKSDRKIAFRPGNISTGRSMCAGPTIGETVGHSPSLLRRATATFVSASSSIQDRAPSSRTLAAMKPGDVIYGSQPAGAFTLPDDPAEKLAFIAGGFGVDAVPQHDAGPDRP